jgi:transposase-like protein
MSRYTCLHCGFNQSWNIRRNGRKCKRCRREWSVSRAVVKGIRADERTWRFFLRCFLRYKTVAGVRMHTRQSRPVVMRMSTMARTIMAHDVPPRLSGICEVDETYIGAQWRNRPWSVRKKGTKKGRGTTKQAIFGIHERSRSVVRAFFVPDVRKHTLLPIIRSHVAPGSTIYSDAYQLYQNVTKYGYCHAFVDHKQHEYVRGPVHSNGMEGFWGVLKRRLKTTGGIRASRLPEYVAEEVWRYNFRSLPEAEKIERLLDLLKRFGG